MITIEDIRAIALNLPETEEVLHNGLPSIRVKKKLFLTMNFPNHRITLRFSPENHDVFCKISQGMIYPVANLWGSKYGWTHANTDTISQELLKDAIEAAWYDTAPDKLKIAYEKSLEE